MIRRRVEAPRVVLRHNLGMLQTSEESQQKRMPAHLRAYGFQPGNKAGTARKRPETKVREAALAECANSIQVLAEMRDNKKTPAAVRHACAKTLLEYGVGKPREMSEEKAETVGLDLSAQDMAAAVG